MPDFSAGPWYCENQRIKRTLECQSTPVHVTFWKYDIRAKFGPNFEIRIITYYICSSQFESMICCWSHTFRNQCFYTGMLGVRLYSSSILLLGEYMDLLVKTELLIVQQSVLHVHNVFWKKWAPLAEFVMYQISWVQTHRLLPIALSLLLRSLPYISQFTDFGKRGKYGTLS